MKSVLLVVFFTLLAFTNVGAATTDSTYRLVYYEKMDNGMTRFFFDDNYYLADKYCQFKTIERIASYDFEQRVFDGEFTDFNNSGQVVLRGHYKNGKKDGNFVAYHPNGQLKWEVDYVQDLPQGPWKYHYPDGKPLLEIQYSEQGVRIQNFWDKKARHRVKEGNGKYEFSIKPDGYNEFGYVFYRRKGRLVEGRPHGNWVIEYLYDGNKKKNAGHEYYQNGRFVSGYETFKDEVFDDRPRYELIPNDFFIRAEYLIGKSCTIDEYSGFSDYLGKNVESWFEGRASGVLDHQQIEFEIEVDEKGSPKKVKAISTFPSKYEASLLLEAFSWINFWFPSFADGEFIADKLTVTAEAFPDLATNKLRVFDVKIEREKGI